MLQTSPVVGDEADVEKVADVEVVVLDFSAAQRVYSR
jgi:hypothetical protein